MTSSTSAGREPSPELLPCPWCGEVPKLWSAPSNVIDHGAAHVEHPDTDCLMRKVVVRAVDWNRRPPVVRGPDQELREAAQRLARYLDDPFVKNSALGDVYMLPVRIGDLRVLRLALSGTTKEGDPHA